MLLALSLGFISCSPETEYFKPSPNQKVLPDEAKALSRFEITILDEILSHRRSKGLSVLKRSDAIRTQVYIHTGFMINASRLSHDNYLEREYNLMQYAGAKSVYEIVASGYHSAEDVVNAWLNSAVHRKGIEGNFTHFNVSAEKNDGGVYYFACMFMKK
ncbi:CAP domain-containing protein [Tamlana crocina]